VDLTSTSGATSPLDGAPGQAQVMLLKDALQIERTQSTQLVQALQSSPSSPPPSLEQGKGAAFDQYA
jgi:hypothetical protein